jgi:hypothetical protein
MRSAQALLLGVGDALRHLQMLLNMVHFLLREALQFRVLRILRGILEQFERGLVVFHARLLDVFLILEVRQLVAMIGRAVRCGARGNPQPRFGIAAEPTQTRARAAGS